MPAIGVVQQEHGGAGAQSGENRNQGHGTHARGRTGAQTRRTAGYEDPDDNIPPDLPLPVLRPLQPRPPSFSTREFRTALGMFATGVTVVTARGAEGQLVGLTANSFNSVSMDPPLVLWSLALASASLPVFATGAHYAINVLASDQVALAEQFAARGIDRWAGVEHQPGISGAPLLAGAAAKTTPPPPWGGGGHADRGAPGHRLQGLQSA